MSNKYLYKLINEELNSFDFLGMNSNKNEFIHANLLSSKEFQTSLINDIINNISNKDIFKKMSATFINTGSDFSLNKTNDVELEVDLTYQFKEKKYNLIMFIEGEINDSEINFENFDIKLFSKAGEEIDISWIENNAQLYTKLLEKLISPYLK